MTIRAAKTRAIIVGFGALIASLALIVDGAFGAFSNGEAQTLNSFSGATWSPSTAPTPSAQNQTPGSNSVLITWSPVTLSDVSNSGSIEYTVVRSPGNTVVCQLTASTSCTDTSGNGGTFYTYTEEAFYVVGGTPTWSLGPSDNSNQITFPQTPSFTTTLVQPGMNTVGHSWNDFATVSGNTNGGSPQGTVAISFCQETSAQVASNTPCSAPQGQVVSTMSAPTSTTAPDISTYDPSTTSTPDTESPTVGTYCYYASFTAPAHGPYSSLSAQTDTECFAVVAAMPSNFTTNLSQPSSTTVGNAWNDAATVTGNSVGGVPTGTVTFTLCPTNNVSNPCTASTSGTVTVDTIGVTSTSGNASTFTLPTADQATPTVGSYCYNAAYNATSGGNYVSVSQQSDSECFTVLPATPTFATVVTTPAIAEVNNTWNDLGTLTGNSVGGAPTGSVTFTVCKESSVGTPCSSSDSIATWTIGTPTTANNTTGVSTYNTQPNSDGFTPTTAGTYCYNDSYTATSGGNYTNVSQESNTECFNVYPADGSGTMTVSPTSEVAGSTGDTLTFTYTPATGGTNNGVVNVALPAGWNTTPQTINSSTAGFTTASGGSGSDTVTITNSGTTIQVSGVTLATSPSVQTLTITYGAGGGSAGITAATTTGSYTFTSSETSVAAGSLTHLTSGSPSVSVTPGALNSLTLNPSTSTPTAGTPFTVSMTALDAFGNVDTNYIGTQCITFSGPSNSPKGNAPSFPAATGACSSGSAVAFSSGVATGASAPSITLYDAQSVTLTATDNPSGKSGTTGLAVGHSTAAATSVFSGNNQSATVSTTYANPLAAQVTDTYGNPVSGQNVTFTAPASPSQGNPVAGSPTITGANALTASVGLSSVQSASDQEVIYFASDKDFGGTVTSSQSAITPLSGFTYAHGGSGSVDVLAGSPPQTSENLTPANSQPWGGIAVETASSSSPSVAASGTAGAGSSVTTSPSFTLSSSNDYLVFVSTTLNAAASSPSFTTSRSFSGTQPTLTSIGTQGYDTTGTNSFGWTGAWYLTGGSGSGTVTIGFSASTKAYLEVVQLPVASQGNPVAGSPTITGANALTASVGLSSVQSASDQEVIYFASDKDFGGTVTSSQSAITPLSGFTYAHGGSGSVDVLAGSPPQTSENLTPANSQPWGGIAVETASSSSPSVAASGTAGAGSSVTTSPSFTLRSSNDYLVFVSTTLNAAASSPSFTTSRSFSGTQPTLTSIGTQGYDTTGTNSFGWTGAWYLTGGSGSGTVTIGFSASTKAYLEVVQLPLAVVPTGVFSGAGCTTTQCLETTSTSGIATTGTLTANGTPGAFTVTAQAPSTTPASFNLANTSVGTSIALNPTTSLYSQTVTITGSGFDPSATLTATVGGTLMSLANGTTDGSGNISGATFTTPSLAPGSYLVVVSDNGPNGATATATLTISGAPNFTSANSTSFNSASSSNSFAVTAVGGPTPTVTNVSSFSGTPSCTQSPTSLTGTGISVVSGGTGSGTATIQGNNPTPGTYTLCLQATSTAGTAGQVFTLTVKTTPTVSVTHNVVGRGQTLTFSATVTGVGSTAPTGTVSWAITPPSGSAPTCSTAGPVSSSGDQSTYTCSVSGAVAGTYHATATFNGDTNYFTASGTDTTATVSTGDLYMYSTNGVGGNKVDFNGEGFGSAKTITATFNGTALTLLGDTTTGSGGQAGQVGGQKVAGNNPPGFTVPSNLAAGTYTVSVTDGTVTASESYTINLSLPNPTSGAVGTTITMTAAGLAANATLTATFGGMPLTITSGGTTSGTGTATVAFAVPPAANGTYGIQLSDGTNTYYIPATSGFTVTGSSGLSGSFTGTNPGPVGTTLTVSGSGFTNGATITVTVGYVNAAITGATKVGIGGSISTTATVPFAGNGTYPVYVSDGTHVALAGTFTINGSFSGLMWNQYVISAGGPITCATPSVYTVCSLGGLGSGGHFYGAVALVTSAATAPAAGATANNTVTNPTGSASVGVSATVVWAVAPGGSIGTTTSGTIPAGSATTSTSSEFQMTMAGVGGDASTMIATLTVDGTQYNIAFSGM